MGSDVPTLGIAFLAGFLSFISPCVLPLIPAYITYLGGRATSQVSMELAAVGAGASAATLAQKNKLSVILHGLAFVGGFTFVFVVFGLLINAGLQALRVSAYDFQVFWGRFGGLLIIFFGLHVMGVTGWVLRKLTAGGEPSSGAGKAIYGVLERIQTALYSDTRRQMNPRNRYGYMGSALMGTVFAAGWTPCVGPIYGAILTVAINKEVPVAGMLLLAYSFGLGFPFLMTAAALDQMRGLLKRLQRHMRAVELISGTFLILVGYLLFTGQLAQLAQFGGGLASFSYNLEGCVTGVFEGKVPLNEFGKCMDLGPDYQYRENKDGKQTSMIAPELLTVLPDGRGLYVR